jgi:hypothetical protein
MCLNSGIFSRCVKEIKNRLIGTQEMFRSASCRELNLNSTATTPTVSEIASGSIPTECSASEFAASRSVLGRYSAPWSATDNGYDTLAKTSTPWSAAAWSATADWSVVAKSSTPWSATDWSAQAESGTSWSAAAWSAAISCPSEFVNDEFACGSSVDGWDTSGSRAEHRCDVEPWRVIGLRACCSCRDRLFDIIVYNVGHSCSEKKTSD